MGESDFDYERYAIEISSSDAVKRCSYQEIMAGGFTRFDGTVEFYTRINALLSSEFHLLDFGAGRAAWVQNDRSPYRRMLRNMLGKVASVTVCDIDEAVLVNPVSNKRVLYAPGEMLPFEDECFDIITADWVFEHIDAPKFMASELARVLKPGGWICARTPNRAGYIGMLTRLINNKFHKVILKHVQPERLEADVFPTRYLLNSMAQVRSHFSDVCFHNHSYHYTSEPGYFFNNKIVFKIMKYVDFILPEYFSPNIHIFLRKKRLEG